MASAYPTTSVRLAPAKLSLNVPSEAGIMMNRRQVYDKTTSGFAGDQVRVPAECVDLDNLR